MYIITKMIRFNYIHSSRRQASQEIQPQIKDFLPWIFRHSPESKGCLKFRLKDFPRLWFSLFFNTIDKNQLITSDFYLQATQWSNYKRNWCYFEGAADLNCEKLGAYKPGQYNIPRWKISNLKKCFDQSPSQ